jgi:hypothetical protein
MFSKYWLFLLTPWLRRNINQIGDLHGRDYLLYNQPLDHHWREIGDPDLAADEAVGQPLGGREIADRICFASFPRIRSVPFPG